MRKCMKTECRVIVVAPLRRQRRYQTVVVGFTFGLVTESKEWAGELTGKGGGVLTVC